MANLAKIASSATQDQPIFYTEHNTHHWKLIGLELESGRPDVAELIRLGTDATQTLAAFFQMVADRQELPRMKWSFKNHETAELRLEINPPAKSARLFTADSPDRDLRNDVWINRVLQSTPSDRAVAQVKPLLKGYRAYMGEVTLTSPTGHDYTLSTEARVVPDEFK